VHAVKDIWKQPTRRAFVAMLGLGAAALAVVTIKPKPPGPPEQPRSTRWIGHC
jgi:hypothetical protein